MKSGPFLAIARLVHRMRAAATCFKVGLDVLRGRVSVSWREEPAGPIRVSIDAGDSSSTSASIASEVSWN